MSIVSAFQAALGKGHGVRSAEKPTGTVRPGSDPGTSTASDQDEALSILPGASNPVVMASHYSLGTGSGHTPVGSNSGEEGDGVIPWHEPDDEEVLYRLFRLRV